MCLHLLHFMLIIPVAEGVKSNSLIPQRGHFIEKYISILPSFGFPSRKVI